MPKFILGLILGFLVGTVIVGAYAAMSPNSGDREYAKFVETNDGKTACLITIMN